MTMPAQFTGSGYDTTIRMMIIDDDLHVLAVLEDLFTTESDVQVTALSDSREAIARLRQEHFDMVITDLMMPKSDGLAVTRAVQELSPETLVIIITGFASLETTLEAIHLGVYDYITKPFQIDEFRLLVSNASKRIRLERENQYLHAQLGAREQQLHQLETVQSELTAELQSLRQQLVATPEPVIQVGRNVAPSANKLSIYERVAGDFRSRSLSETDDDSLRPVTQKRTGS